MRLTLLCPALLCLALLAPCPVQAHRVNIFAFVDGPDIQVECSFSGGKKVRQGRVEILDRQSGALLLSGETNDEGVFRTPVTGKLRAAPGGLVLRIKAGEGHQNETGLSPEELGGQGPDAAPSEALPPAAEPASEDGQTVRPGVSATEMEALVGRAVDRALERRLSPLRREIAESAERIRMRDVAGGIGWLIGLAGLAAFFSRRRG